MVSQKKMLATIFKELFESHDFIEAIGRAVKNKLEEIMVKLEASKQKVDIKAKEIPTAGRSEKEKKLWKWQLSNMLLLKSRKKYM